MTTCTRCNRPLTVYVSVMRGVGPVCWKKLIQENGQFGAELGALLRAMGAEQVAAKPENINWSHLATLVGRIRNDFTRGRADDFEIPPSIEASLCDLVRISDKKSPDDQDRAMVAANAWTIAFDLPDEVLVGGFVVRHIRSLFDLVVMGDEADEAETRLERRKKAAVKEQTIRDQADLFGPIIEIHRMTDDELEGKVHV